MRSIEKTCLCSVFGVVLFSLLVSPVPAATLFTENWDTGVIDPVQWSVTDLDGTDIVLEDPLSNGDYALALKGNQDGGNPHWGDHIFSTASYARGDSLRITFTVWVKPSINTQVAMHGGWHKNGTGPVYNSPEATFGYVVNDIRAQEDGDGLQGGPSMSSFTTALTQTNSKSTSLKCRVTLGNSLGAFWEWSSGGNIWNFGRDTTGVGTSNASVAFIGFGPFDGQAGTTMIDDIIVEEGVSNGGGDPSPLPDDIRDLSEHFTVPNADLSPWIFTPQNNIAQLDTATHAGLATIFEAGNGQDVKGMIDQPIPIGQYPLPWEFQMGIQQAFSVTAGRSLDQLNQAIGLNVVLTFSDPGTWPEDRLIQPANTHSFQLFNVHLGNYNEFGSGGLPQLLTNPNLYRMDADNSPEAYFIYGRGDLVAGQSSEGLWDIPYLWIGDGAKYGGPASNQIYFKCVILNSTQIQIGIKFEAWHGWNTRIINVGQFGSITGIWEIGPIISADNWIPNVLAPALGITAPPAVDVPDPAFEYHIDYCVMKHGNPAPFDHYSDDFDVLGYMGQWQIQEQGTLTEAYTNPGYLTLTLLGTGAGTGICPEGGPALPLATYPPPWEIEMGYISPDDSEPWQLSLLMQANSPAGDVIFMPGVENIPGAGHSFITGFGGNSPFQPNWPTPLPESLLASKPLYMIFQMLDNNNLRIGFRADPNDPWHYSDVYDTTAAMPGGVIDRWLFSCPSTANDPRHGGNGGPAYQKFLIDYMHYRYGLTDMAGVNGNPTVAEEGATSDTYTIALVDVPASNVTVTVDPDNQLQVNSSGQGNPVQLTFTPGDATIPQIVTVSAIDDGLIESDHTGTVTHTSTSTDPAFDSLVIADKVVAITDNDHGCGEPGQVFSTYDVTGPGSVPDCFVDVYDFVAFTFDWLDCTDLSVPGCSW